MGGLQPKTEAEKTDEEIAVKILKVVGEIIENPDGWENVPQITFSKLKQLYEKFKSNGGPLSKKMNKGFLLDNISSSVDQPSCASKITKSYSEKQRIEACQLYDPATCEATSLFIEHLEKELNQNNVSVQKVTKPSKIENKLLLICNQSSRLVTDVERCLKTTEGTDYPRVVLIVLHVKEERALPEVSSKENLLFTNEKYRDLLDIIDVAFTREMGIYNCRMNDKAKQAIADALRP